MNTETGEVKPFSELTDEERNSGKWIPLPGGVRWQKDLNAPSAPKILNKSDRKRVEYMKKVAQKKLEGVNV